ncbi:MAG TPA: NAD-dependent epimerase/dehydratase family protein [Solirubrobacteraceae bacterium]|nr:NAD-dependent epimerase/dehydratase family protein [Solirubrobacteraceae bacterium]
MKVLVTGVTGYVGAVLAPALQQAGHEVRGLSRDPTRARLDVPVLPGDVISGQGLDQALDDVEVAYYLIHAMEPSADGTFAERERRGAERFAAAAVRAGVRRVVYLGGLIPAAGAASPHLASRLGVERVLLQAIPDSVALRASIVIGARSRSFRFLVRLVERLPVIAFPSWAQHRTQPIDERDIVAMLVSAAGHPDAGGRSLDAVGPDVVSYGQLIERIRDSMLLGRPGLRLGRLSLTPIASRVAAVIAGEDHELIGPLMESLETDLLPRDDLAAALLEIRRHRLDAAIEHALGVWERDEPLKAR